MKIEEYETVEHIVKMVIKRLAPACILVSEGGLGKSFMVRSLLSEELNEDEYVISSGHITPLALYKMMYKNSDCIIVLDDVEDVLKSDSAVGILKAALWDVMGDGKRKVTWSSTSKALEDTPQEFTFEGGLILLANKIPRQYENTIKALRSRSLENTIKLTYQQKLKICKQLIDSDELYEISGVVLSEHEREDIKEDLKLHTSIIMESFNFRTVINLIRFYRYNRECVPEDKNLYLKLMESTTKVDEMKSIIYELINNTEISSKQKIVLFQQRTGKSQATFYRLRNELKKDLET